ncbi:451_t:CDS:10 [Racocetra fulgida]|uniref:Exportin-T n=1 Tax=Racocetra fulgida TaxID=60492 RepID=A0A9N8WF66_9GLOM|nr:451_t:CDS:10 [Racocetra fulgida]
MEEQIEQAVAIALSPSSDHTLKSQLLQIRTTLIEFVKREYVLEEVNGVEFSSEPQYFFDEFLALLQINPINGSKTNVRTIDIFLRILMSIDEEVVNLSVPRKKEDAQRNTSIIVCKGMKPLDKFELIQVLNLADVMRRLDLVSNLFVNSQLFADINVDIHPHKTIKQVARLTNVLGVELCKIWEEVDSETKPVVYVQIELLLQFLLKFLADEYDDTSCAVFPFVSALQTVLKRQKNFSGALTGSQREFMDSLLKVVVLKMKYDDETDWGGTEDGAEDAAEFLEMRKNLKSFFEAIYHIDAQLFTTYIRLAVVSTLENYAKLGNALDWRELELALYLLHLYGEAIKGKVQFVEKHNNEITAYTPLGEMMNQMIQYVSSYSHPAITLNFFENISRYSQFFEIQPDCIPPVLGAFVDIRAVIEPSDISADSNPLTKDKAMESGFSEQIFLFETVGILITAECIPPDNQMEFAKVFSTYWVFVFSCCQNIHPHFVTGHPRSILQLHHLIMAIGSIGKALLRSLIAHLSLRHIGFPEAPKGSHPTIPWVGILKQATEIVLAVLKILNRYEIIRDAVCFKVNY